MVGVARCRVDPVVRRQSDHGGPRWWLVRPLVPRHVSADDAEIRAVVGGVTAHSGRRPAATQQEGVPGAQRRGEYPWQGTRALEHAKHVAGCVAVDRGHRRSAGAQFRESSSSSRPPAPIIGSRASRPRRGSRSSPVPFARRCGTGPASDREVHQCPVLSARPRTRPLRTNGTARRHRRKVHRLHSKVAQPGTGPGLWHNQTVAESRIQP
jgi:hypothetical protein